MFDTVGQFLGGIFGGRRSTLAVPILDGVFRPNNLLEEAEILAEQAGMCDMAFGPDGRLSIACGSEVLILAQTGGLSRVAAFDAPITALCFANDGRRVVALGNRIVIEGSDTPLTQAAGRSFVALTAVAPMADGRILVCDASSTHGCDAWRHDLLAKGSSGRVIAIDPDSGQAQVLQSGLAWANGAHLAADGSILVSESWRHRLRLAGKGDATPELPGYPARLTPTPDGGFWLSLFSARMQIVEFVLSERDFRREMMETIDPAYWICPAYSSGRDFLEPLQSGGVKQMGILKPWAPPRSYGLAVRFDARRNPLMSVHSRVGGEHHGIVTVLERGDEVFALSKGAGRLLRLKAARIRAENAIGGDRA